MHLVRVSRRARSLARHLPPACFFVHSFAVCARSAGELEMPATSRAAYFEERGAVVGVLRANVSLERVLRIGRRHQILQRRQHWNGGGGERRRPRAPAGARTFVNLELRRPAVAQNVGANRACCQNVSRGAARRAPHTYRRRS